MRSCAASSHSFHNRFWCHVVWGPTAKAELILLALDPQDRRFFGAAESPCEWGSFRTELHRSGDESLKLVDLTVSGGNAQLLHVHSDRCLIQAPT